MASYHFRVARKGLGRTDIREARSLGVNPRTRSFRVVRALAKDVFSPDPRDRAQGLEEIRLFFGNNVDVSGRGTWATIIPATGDERWCATPYESGFAPIPEELRFVWVTRAGKRGKRAFDPGELADLVMEALGWDELDWTDDMFDGSAILKDTGQEE